MTRSDLEQRVLDALERTGVPYEIVECDPEYADTFPFSEKYGYPVAMSANTIVVASKTEPKQYVACIVLATTRVDANNTAKRWMGVLKVSFAGPEETSALTGMMIGGVTPLALPDDLPILVDPAVFTKDEVIVGGGSRSMKIKVSPRVFERLPNTHVVEGLSMPLASA
ncbi:MAG TPA: YbaK/EbsC family protein [Acidimicrobiales bacterium]|nr:YbaK/EbsC family protein [Acidimicrobiales bacterium]